MTPIIHQPEQGSDNLPVPERRFRKTRIAPTPSGYLHLGNVLSFAFTALLAERYQAQIVLRIDDLDRQRILPAYVQDIFDTLHFLELPWHEGPRDAQELEHTYSQFRRLDLYRDTLVQLEKDGLVFACDCSRTAIAQAGKAGVYPGTCCRKGLALATPGTSLRLHTDNGAQLSFNTPAATVCLGLPEEQRYFVVRKKDGLPAYQLASVVDDLHFGIDLIVRGMDLLPSTLAQLQLAQKLGARSFQQNAFYHHVLMTDENKDKLSKSAGATSVQYLRKHGKKAADIYTGIANAMGIPGAIRDWRGLAPLLDQ